MIVMPFADVRERHDCGAAPTVTAAEPSQPKAPRPPATEPSQTIAPRPPWNFQAGNSKAQDLTTTTTTTTTPRPVVMARAVG